MARVGIHEDPEREPRGSAWGRTHRSPNLVWRFPPYSANTWHKHLDQEELYFVIRGTGRLRVGDETLTIPEGGAVFVSPQPLRQVFNDSEHEVMWLIVGAPREGIPTGTPWEEIYPEDPMQLPAELRGRVWPPENE